MQRAILDLRSQRASELARDLLSSDRPQLSADTVAMLSAAATDRQKQQQQQQQQHEMAPLSRRASSAVQHRPPVQWTDDSRRDRDRDRDAYLLQLQSGEAMANRRPVDTPARPASADCRYGCHLSVVHRTVWYFRDLCYYGWYELSLGCDNVTT